MYETPGSERFKDHFKESYKRIKERINQYKEEGGE